MELSKHIMPSNGDFQHYDTAIEKGALASVDDQSNGETRSIRESDGPTTALASTNQTSPVSSRHRVIAVLNDSNAIHEQFHARPLLPPGAS
jgi:hypothetical protein